MGFSEAEMKEWEHQQAVRRAEEDRERIKQRRIEKQQAAQRVGIASKFNVSVEWVKLEHEIPGAVEKQRRLNPWPAPKLTIYQRMIQALRTYIKGLSPEVVA